MKVTFFNRSFWPDVEATGQLLTELCEDLVARHEVTVVAGRPYQGDGATMAQAVCREGLCLDCGPPPAGKTARTGLLNRLARLPVGRTAASRVASASVNAEQEIDCSCDAGDDHGSPLGKSNRATAQEAGAPGVKVRGRGAKVSFPEGRAGLRVLRAGNTTFDKRRFVLRLFNLVTYFTFGFLLGFRLGKPDVLVTETDPPLVGLLGLFFKHWYRCRFLYYCQDIHPDVGLVTGRLRNRFWVGLLWAANALILRAADRIIVVGDDMKERITAKGVSADRIDVVPNWADSRVVQPTDDAKPIRGHHGLDGKFVVMYSGNVGLSQALEKVIEAAEILRDEHGVHFLFVGEGASKERLQRLAAGKLLSNVTFLPYQPKAALGETLGAADVHLVPLQRGVAGCIVPSKVYGIMAAGRPFIAAVEESSDVGQVAREFSCGLVIPPEDPAALAEAVQWCRTHPRELVRMGANGRKALVEHFDRPIATRRFEEVLMRST